jgi:hypothetical protein
MNVPDDDRWWQRAACGGRDPAWWSADDRPMWPTAVRLCLGCPVRDSCLDEAVRQRDNGVIRAGMLLVDTSRGYTMVPLICANCGLRPVRLTGNGGVPRYCGRACQAARARVRARTGTRPGADGSPRGRRQPGADSPPRAARQPAVPAVS